MTTAEFLSYLHSLDVKIWADGDRLRYSAAPGVLTAALRSDLLTRKSEILDLLHKDSATAYSPSLPLTKLSQNGEPPLSFAQQRLWFLVQMEPNSALYNIARALRLTGKLNVDALQQALNAIVERHEILRTNFISREHGPVQVIREKAEVELQVLDLSTVAEAGREEHVQHFANEQAREPFDLTSGPLLRACLLRLNDSKHVFILIMHHIISDGWSLSVFNHELAHFYRCFCLDSPASLPALPIQYSDFSLWQRACLDSHALKPLLAYWSDKLADLPASLDLPQDRLASPSASQSGRRMSVSLPEQLTRRLSQLSRKQGATLFMTLLAAFKVLLSRLSGQSDIVVGTPMAGRNRAELEGLIGFFVNTLVLRTEVRGETSFEEMLMRVREVCLGAYAHQDLPFEKLVEHLQPARDLNRSPLFQVMFALQNAPQQTLELPDLRLETLSIERGTEKFDLSLFVYEVDEGLKAVLSYSTDLFDAATIERMLGYYQRLLEAVAANPDGKLSDLPLLTRSQQRQLLVEWNDTKVDYPKNVSIQELFEAQAAKTPDRLAVVFEDRRLTYAELNNRANQLASYLRKLGVGPEALVGIAIERSIEMVVGLLGILKSGGAYVPIDPEYPQQRVAFMLEDASAPVLLTERKLVETLPAYRSSVICLDTDWEIISREPGANLSREITQGSAAYMIYTSGSTGKPKGAINTQQGICNRLLWMKDTYPLSESDRVLQKTPFSFDISIWEFFWPLISGASLVVARPGGHKDSAYLINLIDEQKISAIHFVPSMLQVFLEEQGLERCSSLRHVICGGEALAFETQQQFFASVDAELHDLYGPTEAAVEVTFWDCKRQSELRVVPIGRPIANTQIYLLDKSMNPAVIGSAGELHIGGTALARGYHNRPDLTAEKFIPDPFSDEPGSRLYRTGDLARHLPDGNIEYLGRIDHQVKLRGFRIELGEIETALSELEEVRESVVIAHDDLRGEKRLVAYVVANVGRGLDISQVRGALKKRLPEYMMPSAFVVLDRMPLAPNGKLDRRALPLPDSYGMDLKAEYVAPCNDLERAIAAIWQDLLRVEKVGRDDNFFDLGGHSLLAVQALSRMNSSFKAELPLPVIFESPTVVEMAERIEAAQPTAAGIQWPPLIPAPRDGELPLSFAQQRLWFLDQFDPHNPAYHITARMRLTGAINAEALERSLNEIVRRHEALRTCFATVDGDAVQVIHQQLVIPLTSVDLSALGPGEREAETLRIAIDEARQPFDLARGPLIRASLLRLSDNEHVLLLTIHHIVFDGWSLGVFNREMAALYNSFIAGEPARLGELPIQYADYAVWQRECLQGESLNKLLDYWKRKLADVASLRLPFDHPRPSVKTYRGARQKLKISASLTRQLEELSKQEGVTLFMTLLAAFNLMLSKLTGQQDIVVGTDVAGRSRAELEGLIGFFVNHVVMRTEVRGKDRFREYLRRVGKDAVEAFAHQDLPFDRLVKALKLERNLDHTPLFNVLFVMQNVPVQPLDLQGLSLNRLEVDNQTTKYDLTLFVERGADGLLTTWRYNSDLFDQASISRLATSFSTLVDKIVGRPEAELEELDMESEEEVERAAEQKQQRKQTRASLLKSARRKTLVSTGEMIEETDLVERTLAEHNL